MQKDSPWSMVLPTLSTPEQWKTAIVIPIAKPEGKGHFPISLLYTLFKIIVRIIIARLLWTTLKTKNICGFIRQIHS